MELIFEKKRMSEIRVNMVTLEITPDEWKTFVVGSKVTLEEFCNSDKHWS